MKTACQDTLIAPIQMYDNEKTAPVEET